MGEKARKFTNLQLINLFKDYNLKVIKFINSMGGREAEDLPATIQTVPIISSIGRCS